MTQAASPISLQGKNREVNKSLKIYFKLQQPLHLSFSYDFMGLYFEAFEFQIKGVSFHALVKREV